MHTKRNIYLVFATLTMLIAGMMYNLTVFYDSIEASINCSLSDVALTFSISQFMFCIGGLILGYTFNKVNFKLSMIAGSAVMGLGLFLSSRVNAVWQLYLTYSVMMSTASGFLYKAVLSAVIPWFIDKPGLASGIMMMGSGLTAFVLNVPTTYLIAWTDWRTAMGIIAAVAFAVTSISSLLIEKKEPDKESRNYQNSTQPSDNDVSTKDMMRSPKFYIYFIWTVLLLAGCTSVTGNCIGLSKDIGLTAGSAAILSMVISLSNSISRIWYGSLYDHKGRKISMGIATVFFAIGAVCLQTALILDSIVLMIAAFIAIGMSFGGVPTISSTYILRTFGRKNYASNFAVQGSYSLFSPIFGSSLFTVLYRMNSSYQISFAFVLIYAAMSVFLYLGLNHYISSHIAISTMQTEQQ